MIAAIPLWVFFAGWFAGLLTVAGLLGVGMLLIAKDNRAEDLIGPVGRERLP